MIILFTLQTQYWTWTYDNTRFPSEGVHLPNLVQQPFWSTGRLSRNSKGFKTKTSEFFWIKSQKTTVNLDHNLLMQTKRMLIFKVSYLFNAFAKHVHQAKATLTNSISLQQAKQESYICFKYWCERKILLTYSICGFLEPCKCCLVVLLYCGTPLRIHLLKKQKWLVSIEFLQNQSQWFIQPIHTM